MKNLMKNLNMIFKNMKVHFQEKGLISNVPTAKRLVHIICKSLMIFMKQLTSNHKLNVIIVEITMRLQSTTRLLTVKYLKTKLQKKYLFEAYLLCLFLFLPYFASKVFVREISYYIKKRKLKYVSSKNRYHYSTKVILA